MPVDVREVMGETVRRRKSTAKLSTAEFGEYLEQVIGWAAERGILVPPAGDYSEWAT